MVLPVSSLVDCLVCLPEQLSQTLHAPPKVLNGSTALCLITESLIIKFEQLRKGLAPDFTAGKYEKMLEIRNAMHVVVQTNEGAGFPLSLSCRI